MHNIMCIISSLTVSTKVLLIIHNIKDIDIAISESIGRRSNTPIDNNLKPVGGLIPQYIFNYSQNSLTDLEISMEFHYTILLSMAGRYASFSL